MAWYDVDMCSGYEMTGRRSAGHMVYEFDSRVRYSEVDSQGKLTWLALMDYFQDCSVFQSESLGIGVDYLAENHQAWVLTSWQIVLNAMPK